MCFSKSCKILSTLISWFIICKFQVYGSSINVRGYYTYHYFFTQSDHFFISCPNETHIFFIKLVIIVLHILNPDHSFTLGFGDFNEYAPLRYPAYNALVVTLLCEGHVFHLLVLDGGAGNGAGDGGLAQAGA